MILGTGYSEDILLIISFLAFIVLLFSFLSYKFLRIFLFLFNAESIHNISFKLIKFGAIIPGKIWAWRLLFKVRDSRLQREVFGLKFENPVGLAAGFDKDAKLFDELASFGFGFIEIGTVTPLAQKGNPKPRLFRLKDDQSLINRMGFNNEGIEAVIARLRRKKTDIIIGGNIGKNKNTSNTEAINDYEICFKKLYPFVDYFVVNVSSPNTPGLRELQNKQPLTLLLRRLQELNKEQKSRKPILLKISPDLTHEQLDDIIFIVKETKIDGLVATNTTTRRNNLKTVESKIQEIGDGGLSGKAVRLQSTEIIRYISKKSNNAFPIIGVGGIHSAEDALEKIDAGASLVQVYTGFIYEGPKLIKSINKAILKK